jgi:hypothetical protein
MIKHKDKIIVYFIGGSAGVCPKCGNGNAMLDGGHHVEGGRYVRTLDCRDCGFTVKGDEYREVSISYNSKDRVYIGKVVYGPEVELAPFDDINNRPSIKPLMRYLADHPVPETW